MAESLKDFVVSVRRHIHRHPELSWQESKTKQFVQEQLESLGLASISNLTSTGLICMVPDQSGNVDGPCVALRADMDALPVVEKTGLPFSSEAEGVMHACGHDGHTAILLGAARLLIEHAPVRPVKLIFQPAEEVASGAYAMRDANCLDDVQFIFGGHLDNRFPVGTIITHHGCVNASTDTLHIKVLGSSGHAARPHQCVDATVVAAAIVMQLQTVVARTVDPADPAVLTIGKLTSGTSYNVVSGFAHLEGTIRCLDPSVRSTIHDRITSIAQHTCAAHGATCEVEFKDGIPAVINDELSTTMAVQAAQQAGASAQPLPKANMGGEDFGVYLKQVPGCYARYGAAIPGRDAVSAHSATWDFNEDVLPLAATFLSKVAHVATCHIAEAELK